MCDNVLKNINIDAKSYIFNYTNHDERIDAINEMIKSSIINPEVLFEKLNHIICILHYAKEVNEKIFLSEIFLEWFIIQQKLRLYHDRVLEGYRNLTQFTPYSKEEKLHLINIYRNIVSDLFDPYISLLVSSYQFLDNKFISFEHSNLSQAEFNKYEYLISKNRILFDNIGYNSIVRNAISHSGSSGITIKEHSTIFLSIKRGDKPEIKRVTWTDEELYKNTFDLYNFIKIIDICTNIFGYDCYEIIQNDIDLKLKFYFSLPENLRKSSIENINQYLNNIIDNPTIDNKRKIEMLSMNLKYNFDVRKMSFYDFKFNFKRKLIYISIPYTEIKSTDNNELIHRLFAMIRYTILSRSHYRNLIDNFIIEEIPLINDSYPIKCYIKSDILDEYINEKAGIIDIVSESSFYINKNPLIIKINFDNLKKIEDENYLENPPIRKLR